MQLPAYCIVEGRRPRGLVSPEPIPGATVLGDYFARAAYFEAASVAAFARLGRQLEAHGAPERLVDACHRARLAELDHARHMSRLARRHGARPPSPRAQPMGARSLVDLALENIVEGFVRETYGAVVAEYRARAAGDPEIREVMNDVARDERRHAELAFDIAVWLQSVIDPVEAAWVENELRHAVVSLAREIDVEVHPELCERVGVPSRLDALAIWSGLSKRVWHGLSELVWNAAAA